MVFSVQPLCLSTSVVILRLGSSKCQMHTQAEDRHGAAIAVVGGVIDALEVEGYIDSLAQFAVVVQLQDFFRAVVEPAVADDETEATGCQEVAVRVGQSVDHPGNAGFVLRPPPTRAFEQQAGRDRFIDLRERPAFGLTVVPAGTEEGAQVARQLLLEVEPEAVLGSVSAKR